jgi:hypothetical protein
MQMKDKRESALTAGTGCPVKRCAVAGAIVLAAAAVCTGIYFWLRTAELPDYEFANFFAAIVCASAFFAGTGLFMQYIHLRERDIESALKELDAETAVKTCRLKKPFAKEIDFFYLTRGNAPISVKLHIIRFIGMLTGLAVITLSNYIYQRANVFSVILAGALFFGGTLMHLIVHIINDMYAGFAKTVGEEKITDEFSAVTGRYRLAALSVWYYVIGMLSICTLLTFFVTDYTLSFALFAAFVLSCACTFIVCRRADKRRAAFDNGGGGVI